MSDTQIAEWLNQQPQIYVTHKWKQPLNKETVRDLMQNRVYTGAVIVAANQDRFGQSSLTSKLLTP